MAQLLIFGAGDIARLAWHYFTTDSAHEVVAFTVDPEFLETQEFCGQPVLPFEAAVREFPSSRCQMFVALSYARMNAIRAGTFARAKELGYALPSYISSRCTYLSDAPPGENCLILEDNTIQPFVTIGSNVFLWSGNHVGHDVTIEDHCFISSHVVLSGHVSVGERSFLGVNATIRDSVRIAPRTLVGAGSVVVADTVEGGVYAPPRARLAGTDSEQAL